MCTDEDLLETDANAELDRAAQEEEDATAKEQEKGKGKRKRTSKKTAGSNPFVDDKGKWLAVLDR